MMYVAQTSPGSFSTQLTGGLSTSVANAQGFVFGILGIMCFTVLVSVFFKKV